MALEDHFKNIFDALVVIFDEDEEGRKFSVHGGEHKAKPEYPAVALYPGAKRTIKEHTGRRRKLPVKVWYDFEVYVFVDAYCEQLRALGSEGITKQLARVESILKKDANRTLGGTCAEIDWSDADFDTVEGKVDFCHFVLSCRRTETESNR